MNQMELINLGVKLLVGIVLSIWMYKDSRSRDFSWIFWTIAPIFIVLTTMGFSVLTVVFVCILFLAIYLGARPKGGFFKCPHCNKLVYEDLFICPYCRKNAKHECLDCHEPVPWNELQCPYCNSRDLTKD